MELHWVIAAFMGSSLLLSSLQICIHSFGNCWYHLLLPSSRWQTVQNKCIWIPQPLQRSTQSTYVNISDTNNIIGGYSIMVLPAQQRVTAVTWIKTRCAFTHSNFMQLFSHLRVTLYPKGQLITVRNNYNYFKHGMRESVACTLN